MNPGTPAAEMDADRKSDVSPITFASKDDPPVLLVHGSADKIVPIDHAKVLQSALRKVGTSAQLRIVEGGRTCRSQHPAGCEIHLRFLSAASSFPGPNPPEKPNCPRKIVDSLESHTDLTYATYGDRALQLDLYRPKSKADDPLPGLVCIHGGGWHKGNRESHGNLAKALAARGFVATTISYRLSGEKPFPAAIKDCKAAVRWLRANAKQYGVDPKKIGATGLSAGGHLTALLATSGGVSELEGDGGHADASSKIQAAVPFGAQTDLMSERTRTISKTSEIWRKFLGGSQAEQTDNYRLASPLVHLDASDPPVLLMAGEFDDPSTRADVFRKKMKDLGLDTGFIKLHGGPHAFLGGQNWFDTCIDETAAFFNKHLK